MNILATSSPKCFKIKLLRITIEASGVWTRSPVRPNARNACRPTPNNSEKTCNAPTAGTP